MPLRDADELLAAAVAETLDALDLKPEDAAAKKLAAGYAEVIDYRGGHCRDCEDENCQRVSSSAWAMRWLAPLLLDVLTELGATPAARARLTKGAKPANAPKSQLEALRKARTASRGA